MASLLGSRELESGGSEGGGGGGQHPFLVGVRDGSRIYGLHAPQTMLTLIDRKKSQAKFPCAKSRYNIGQNFMYSFLHLSWKNSQLVQEFK